MEFQWERVDVSGQGLLCGVRALYEALSFDTPIKDHMTLENLHDIVKNAAEDVRILHGNELPDLQNTENLYLADTLTLAAQSLGVQLLILTPESAFAMGEERRTKIAIYGDGVHYNAMKIEGGATKEKLQAIIASGKVREMKGKVSKAWADDVGEYERETHEDQEEQNSEEEDRLEKINQGKPRVTVQETALLGKQVASQEESRFKWFSIPHVDEPHVFECQRVPILNTSRKLPGADFESYEVECPDVLGVGNSMLLSRDDLNKHHDFVVEKWVGKTDIKIDDIFGKMDGVIGGNFTPDCVLLSDPLSILELTTRNTTHLNSLKDAFYHKRHTYEQHLKVRAQHFQIRTTYYILVVGVDKVLTNLPISQTLAEELCLRYRFIKQEQNWLMTQGKYWFRGLNEDDEIKELKTILTDMKVNYIDEFFNEEFYLKCKNLNVDFQSNLRKIKIASAEAFKRASKPVEQVSRAAWAEKIKKNPVSDKLKRIVPFPAVIPSLDEDSLTGGVYPLIYTDGDIMARLWSEAFIRIDLSTGDLIEVGAVQKVAEDYERAIHDLDPERKKTVRERKMLFSFKTSLSQQDRETLAKKGIDGKLYRESEVVVEDRKEKKKSLDPDVYTEDISEFLRTFDLGINEYCLDSHHLSDLLCGDLVTEEVKIPLKLITNSKLGRWARFVSDVATELALNLTTNTRPGQFLIRKLPHFNCYILMKTTDARQHIFFSIGFWNLDDPELLYDEEDLTIDGESRIFSKLHSKNCVVSGEEETFYYTDFVSFKGEKLSHIVKTESMIPIIFASSLDYLRIGGKFWERPEHPRLAQVMAWQLLLFLENKTCTEEMVGLSRFMFMEAMQMKEFKPQPTKIINRFPSVLRSRLQVYCVNCLASESLRLQLQPPVRITNRSETGKVVKSWSGLMDPFMNMPIDEPQMVKSMFMAYIVSKDVTAEKNNAIKLAEKIYTYEKKFRDLLDRRPNPHLTEPEGLPDWHEYSPDFLSFLCGHTRLTLEEKYGEAWEMEMEMKVLHGWASLKIEDLMTLKASARYKGEKRTDFNDIELFKDGGEGKKDSKKHYSYRRPRVIEALIFLKKDKDMGLDEATCKPYHFLQKCLDTLNKRGNIHVDLFRKAQHMGLREIYVIEIMARVVQLFLEKIARVYCSEFDSEIMMHPTNKYNIPLRHGKQCSIKKKQYITLNMAADAAKWNQAHFVAKFSDYMIKITPKIFHPFIFNAMQLWVQKDIMLPMELIESFEKHGTAKTTNEVYAEIRSEYLNGGNIITKDEVCMRIKSGMMQGILHFTSSMLHTSYQEWLRDYLRGYLFRKYETIISCQQSSDDSGLQITVVLTGKEKPAEIQKILRIMKFSFLLKDTLGRFIGIFESNDKTSRNLSGVYEFNSEFFFENSWIRPVNKWIYASLSVRVVEGFAERLEENSNLIQNVIEGGASFQIAALCQMGQAYLHYRMIGLNTHRMASRYNSLLRSTRDPSLGYYPLSPTLCCGMLGFKFDLYVNLKHSSYNRILKDWLLKDSKKLTGNVSSQGTYMKGTKIRWGDNKLYQQMLKNLSLDIEWKEKSEENPEFFFREPQTWEEVEALAMFKLTNPSVIQSLSLNCAVTRMLAGSVYFMDNKVVCRGFAWRNEGKHTLLHLCEQARVIADGDGPLMTEDELGMIFEFKKQYDSYYQMLTHLVKHSKLIGTKVVKRSRTYVTVFNPQEVQSVPLAKLAAYKWWGIGNMRMSRNVINHFWELKKEKYSWLRDSWEETQNEGFGEKVETIELVSLVLKTDETRKRVLFLTDSTGAKSLSFGVQSAIRRGFCTGYELSFDASRIDEFSQVDDSVKHSVFSLCHLGMYGNGLYHELSQFKDNSWLQSIEEDKDSVYGPLKTAVLVANLVKKQQHNEIPLRKIIEQAKVYKWGTIGHFIRIEDTSFENNQLGLWIGKMGGTTVMIEGGRIYKDGKYGSYQNKLTKVWLNKNDDLKEVRGLMKNLLKEVGWLALNEKNTQIFDLTYTDQGFRVNCSVGVPVILNRNLIFNDIPDVESLSVEAKQGALQVKALNKGERRRYTIMQYKVRRQDYDSTQGCRIDSRIAYLFAKNRPLPIAHLKTSTNANSWLEKNKPHLYFSFFQIRIFRKVLFDLLRHKYVNLYGKHSVDEEEDYYQDSDVESMDEERMTSIIKRILNSVRTGEVSFDKQLFDDDFMIDNVDLDIGDDFDFDQAIEQFDYTLFDIIESQGDRGHSLILSGQFVKHLFEHLHYKTGNKNRLAKAIFEETFDISLQEDLDWFARFCENPKFVEMEAEYEEEIEEYGDYDSTEEIMPDESNQD